MIRFLLEVLADFGLIYQDYKHRKRITQKEKKDGKKRPFQKYILQPSNILFIVALLIGSISGFMFFTYQRATVFPEKTRKEITEMSERMENWHKKFGQYPKSLSELIGNNPIQQNWSKDAWNRAYKFLIIDHGNAFLIISSGADGKFNTKDDIRSH